MSVLREDRDELLQSDDSLTERTHRTDT